MEIDGQNFSVKETYDRVITVPDCFVVRSNKVGLGNGEAKLYIGNKDVMTAFFNNGSTFSKIPCFLLKKDLLQYLESVKTEYCEPSKSYYSSSPQMLKKLWHERYKLVESLPDVVEFKIDNQDQIAGPRGYIKSADFGYRLIRELSLPLITYISVMQISDNKGAELFYFKLFVDYEVVNDLALHYGTKHNQQKDEPVKQIVVSRSSNREGQAKYREKLLLECPFCPITMINEERILIASHIKPYARCNENERYDPNNGFILSPLYDKLFDKGFITFDEKRNMIISDWLSSFNKRRLGLTKPAFVQRLPLNAERLVYLEFHWKFVFQGIL